MAKALGRDINEFYNNHFPENCCVDDDAEWIESFTDGKGNMSLVQGEKYDLNDFGYIVNENTGVERRFATVFKKWLNTQNTVTLAIEVPKEKEKEVRQKLKDLGLKVV